ncbi:glycosyltransferase [Nocardiopsis protaetiae]|uniref:glycosyltransferase n=1 Tax=Nocardiopsis protaetiae TaxID=3382270 RepID=UPI00387B6661
MNSYLFVVSSGGIQNGAHVLNRRISEELARGHAVHMITLGESFERPGIGVSEWRLEDLDGAQREELNSTFPYVDRWPLRFQHHLEGKGPAELGLPENPEAFTAVIGFGDTTTPGALMIRDRFYPGARVGSIITMDPEALETALGDPEMGRYRAWHQGTLFQHADLVIAHGPKSGLDAERLMERAGEPGGGRTPIHTFIPGNSVEGPAPAPRSRDEPMEVLMLGRMGDPNKGAIDVARAVGQMRRQGYDQVRLTLQGVDQAEMADFSRTLDEEVGPGWHDFVEVREFSDSRERLDAVIDRSHVMAMASESEAYGLAAAEAASRGKPVVVAKGNGNGFAVLMEDERFIPAEAGSRLVIDDSGSVSHLGNPMGEAGSSGVDRYKLFARKLIDVHDDPEKYHEAALVVREALRGYSDRDAAQSLDTAVSYVRRGGTLDTLQRPGGETEVVSPGQGEGMAADTGRGLLRDGPPRVAERGGDPSPSMSADRLLSAGASGPPVSRPSDGGGRRSHGPGQERDQGIGY